MTPGRHRAALLLAGLSLAFVAPGVALAQVTGRVVDAAGAGLATEVFLEVHDGTQVVFAESGTSNAAGDVRWDGVPARPDLQARMVAMFDGAEYVSAPMVLDNGAGSMLVTVHPVAREGRPLHLDTLHLIVQAEDPSVLRVLQFMTVSNAGAAAFGGGPELQDGRQAGLVIPVPPTATNIRPAPFPSAAAALPEGEAEFGSDRILDPRPVPPGGRQVAVTYELSPDSGADVVLRLPYPTQSVSLLLGGAAREALTVTSDVLQSQGSQMVGDQSYDLWAAEALQPGSQVVFQVAPPALSLTPDQWALIGVGIALLGAIAASLWGGASHDFNARRRQEVIAAIARLDDQYAAAEIPAGEYHRRRGLELERLLLLAPPAADAPDD